MSAPVIQTTSVPHEQFGASDQTNARGWTSTRLLVTIAMLATIVAMIDAARSFWGFTLDDAFITLRYASHLAKGLGPSWNPGAEPAEGYTTVLWMLILAGAQAVGLDGLWFAKTSGVLFGIAAVAAAARLAWQACPWPRFPRTLAAAAVFAISISYWPLSLHAVSGMETTFSCLILTVFLYLSVAFQDASEQTARPLALTALLVTLTRPEAGLLCIATLAALLRRGNERQRRVLLSAAIKCFVAPGALYFVWRWQHFGLLFPLSFYVKATGRPWFTGLPEVLSFFKPFVWEQPWWGALFLLGCTRAGRLLPALIGAACLTLFFVFPEHIMAFESRYMLPLFPLFAAIAGLGAARLAARLLTLGTPSNGRVVGTMFGCLASLVSLTLLPFPGNPRERAQPWLAYGANLRRAHVALAHDLAGVAQRGSIALLDVGAVGYYADWHIIDTFGLNDARVALSQRTDVAYVLDQSPDLLVVVSSQPGTYTELFAWETALYQAARARSYQPLCDYKFDEDYYLRVLARPGSDTVRGQVCRTSSNVGTFTASREP